MKQFILFVLVLTSVSSAAQESILPKTKTFKITIRDTGGSNIRGWLADISDSSVYMSSGQLRFRASALPDTARQQFKFTQINVLAIKRKNSGARGFLIGLVSGCAAGAIVGIASGDDTKGLVRYSAGDKALAAGAFLGLTGGLVGAIVGSFVQKIFVIKGSKEKFREAHLQILRRAYRH